MERPKHGIWYAPVYTHLTGSLSSGVLLSQIIAWWEEAGGPFFKTDAEVMEATGLGTGEIRRAKVRLKTLLSIRATGVPPTTRYEVREDALVSALESLSHCRTKASIRAEIQAARTAMQREYPMLFLTIGRRRGFRCQRCPSTDDLTIDHILPLIKGGKNDEANLQLLCATCNSSKGTRTGEALV